MDICAVSVATFNNDKRYSLKMKQSDPEMNTNTISKSELRKKDPIGQLLDSLCNDSKSEDEVIGSAFKPIIKNTSPPTFMPKYDQTGISYNQCFYENILQQHCSYPNQIFPMSQRVTHIASNYMLPAARNYIRDVTHFPLFPKQVYHAGNDKLSSKGRNTISSQSFQDVRQFPFFPWMKVSPLHQNLTKQKFCSVRPEKPSNTSHHPPRYQCESCNKSYSTFGGLSKHRQFHCVNQIKKEFGCKFCGKSYGSLGALKMHIRTHTLPCKCKLCGKAFSRPWLLQGHVRTHTGEKPFRCEHCGRAFADRSNLRAHLQTHSDIKKYGCKNCSKTFSRMSLLTKHKENNNCVRL